MKARLILKEILPFYFRLVVLAAVTLFIDLILHLTNLVWIGRYIGIPGVILILLSFGHSLRKRGFMKSDNPIRLLRLHEWLAWIGSTLVLVAVAAMAINITSGLTGKYLMQRALRWMKQTKADLREAGLTDTEIEQRLFWDSLAAGLVRKWRAIHLPIALAFAVLATAHILSTFLFWGWK